MAKSKTAAKKDAPEARKRGRGKKKGDLMFRFAASNGER
jgi:hypothetical protein